MSLQDIDFLITCPYEKSHRIFVQRLQTHLVKCKKSHADSRLVACPFNATHRIPEVELHHHITYLCQNKGAMDIYLSESKVEKTFIPPLPVTEVVSDGGENWDNEDHPTYVPENYCLNNPVLFSKKGLNPKERKAHRLEERKRLQQFKNVIKRNK